jgi:hypothetical protein
MSEAINPHGSINVTPRAIATIAYQAAIESMRSTCTCKGCGSAIKNSLLPCPKIREIQVH